MSSFSARLLTILPDYLYRRYAQGRRIGKEITLYSVWFELRWGIIACLMLTVGLITMIFYFHPSTSNAPLFYRTVPIVPETNGRVAEIYRRASAMRSNRARRSSGWTARSRRRRRRPRAARSPRSMRRWWPRTTDVIAAEGKIQDAKSAYQQALDELETKQELQRRNPGIVAARGISRGSSSPSMAAAGGRRRRRRKGAPPRRSISTSLPTQKASAEAALAQAEVDLGRPSSAPASADAWSNSRCGSATSSTRSSVRPGS